MMKNILNIDIYLPKCKTLIFLTKRITALSKTVLLSNTFQKVQTDLLIFSEDAR